MSIGVLQIRCDKGLTFATKDIDELLTGEEDQVRSSPHHPMISGFIPHSFETYDVFQGTLIQGPHAFRICLQDQIGLDTRRGGTPVDVKGSALQLPDGTIPGPDP